MLWMLFSHSLFTVSASFPHFYVFYFSISSRTRKSDQFIVACRGRWIAFRNGWKASSMSGIVNLCAGKKWEWSREAAQSCRQSMSKLETKRRRPQRLKQKQKPVSRIASRKKLIGNADEASQKSDTSVWDCSASPKYYHSTMMLDSSVLSFLQIKISAD